MNSNDGWVRVRYVPEKTRNVGRTIFLARTSEVLSGNHYVSIHRLDGQPWGLATAMWLEIVDE